MMSAPDLHIFWPEDDPVPMEPELEPTKTPKGPVQRFRAKLNNLMAPSAPAGLHGVVSDEEFRAILRAFEEARGTDLRVTKAVSWPDHFDASAVLFMEIVKEHCPVLHEIQKAAFRHVFQDRYGPGGS